MEHPLPSISTNSCSLPAGSLSPTLTMCCLLDERKTAGRQYSSVPAVARGARKSPRFDRLQTSMAFCTRRVTTHDLVLEIGRLSAISTTSPSLYSPFSSCAWYLLDLATILP